jgi:hypothetical protein
MLTEKQEEAVRKSIQKFVDHSFSILIFEIANFLSSFSRSMDFV